MEVFCDGGGRCSVMEVFCDGGGRCSVTEVFCDGGGRCSVTEVFCDGGGRCSVMEVFCDGGVLPLEAMGSLRNRWSYGFAFGASSRFILMLFSQKHLLFPTPGWARPFVFLLGALEIGLVYFPFFACLSTPARGVGAVLGLGYTLAWLGIMLTSVIICPHGQVLGRYENLMTSWPTIISFLFLLGRYAALLVKSGRAQQEAPGGEMEHLVQHVKRLLRKPPPPRKHMKRLWAGHKGFLPEKLRTNVNPASSVAAIARYSGCQIAYTLWGYTVTHILHFLMVLMLVYLTVVPVLHGQTLEQLAQFGYAMLSLAVVLAVSCLQVKTVQMFFLQDKLKPTDRYKPLALNNRRAFHCFTYFFFFSNVVLGLGACLLRLLRSLAVGAVLLARIDRTIMPRGHEAQDPGGWQQDPGGWQQDPGGWQQDPGGWQQDPGGWQQDPGYTWWAGMILADHHHGNPTLVCFCSLLTSTSTQTPSAQPPQSGVSSRARRRWALVYTLLRNPALTLLRTRLLASSSISQSAISQSDPSQPAV
ncbi:hypothetical protein CRUP_009731 [Coryphaenoides rupestris]|nr:hypothetical protein CRUP_009731 [Coryphaenoides rupestris]